ncbi:MAG: SUMF1/EgtB/PvdO family nonheme iron enzyme [bacterium]|nr:SUMF1/EgtB/PvdO family nonheme iron enzyme [bacterium]
MTSVDNRPLRVFLCHSSHDKPAVRELYQKLRAEAWIQPWLDEEELYPGQDWNMEIEKAVEAADAIIVCLTKNSINKEGYVQRELRIVLDFADYKPEGTLYIMPVRLEECEPPRRLRPWQYADYFEGQRDRSFQRLLVSLKRRADSLGLKIEKSDLPIDQVSSPTEVIMPKESQAESLIYETPAPKTEEKPVIKKNSPIDKTKPATKYEKLIWPGKVKPTSKYEELILPENSPIDKAKFTPKKDKKTVKEESHLEDISLVEASKSMQSVASANKLTLSNGMEFMHVPAGKFFMGSKDDNRLASGNERPQHTVDISYDYWMARFPITNELYNAYAKAKKIKHPVDGWEQKKNHPVVIVGWNEVMAYCQLLNSLLKTDLPFGFVLRLPTEAEWEKAARWLPSPRGVSRGGSESLEYPWGNEFNKNICNTSEGEKNGTTPVGLYSPQGDSPYGCADMAGNVWEWTHSLIKDYPYKVNDGREDEKASTVRTHVLRGGSFFYNEMKARCAYRNEDGIYVLLNYIGFRLCIAPPLPQ